MKTEVPVAAVWLLTTGDRLQVCVEVGGVWRVAIDEPRPRSADGLPLVVSHIADGSGFRRLPALDLGE